MIYLCSRKRKTTRTMKKIGFRNFRKFVDFPTINLGDVTYLVGQNNAGKSTMVKAMILLAENLTAKSGLPLGTEAFFHFDTPNYNLHINTFDDALNFDALDKTITFKAQIGIFDFQISVQPADDENLYNHMQMKTDRIAPISRVIVEDSLHGISVTIYPFQQRYEVDFRSNEWADISSVEEINSTLKIIRREHRNAVAHGDQMAAASLLLEIEQLKSKRDLMKRTQNQNVGVGKAILHSLPMTYSNGYESMPLIAREIMALADFASHVNLSRPTESILAMEMNRSEMSQQRDSIRLLKDHSKDLRMMARQINAVLSSIDITYIQAHLANQEKALVPRLNHSDEFAKAVEKYMLNTARYDRDGVIKRFLLKWMDEKHFNIGKDFKIIEEEEFPGIYKANVLTFNDHWVNVADMGMGSNQLMILLVQIANSIQKARTRRAEYLIQHEEAPQSSPTIIIEEPEQNLHPMLQSFLADLFYELATDYSMQLIIETHSEYIIRKTQLIVAREKYKNQSDVEMNNAQTVYYFPDSKPPYKMEYNEKGLFTNDFDRGFFDEAGNSAIKLMTGDI